MPILLQINSVINSGSTGRIAEEIGETVISNGWESYIVYGRNDRPSKSKKIKVGNKLDILYHVLKTRLFDRHCFASKQATKSLIKQIQSIKPDIIHLHNVHGYYLNIKILFNYLEKANIPIVWTLHDCWSFTGHCAYFDFAKCTKWETHCDDCPIKKSYPTSYLLDKSKKNYSDKKYLFNLPTKITLVPVSKWLEDLTKKSFIQNHSINQIYNGVNLNTFTPSINIESIKKKWNVENYFIVLGVASVWDKRKGLEDFVQLSYLIEKDIKIILVGLSENQIKTLPSNIIGIKRTENVTELADLYSIADLYANLTYEDNFPTTNIEALACGTPILTYNTGGSIEAITSKTGFIIEQGNIQEVNNIINTLKKTGKKDYIEVCRQRAINHFNKNDRFYDYFKLYEKILKNK